ncbi:hypothetical protein [Rhizobium sp. PL01]|uniref:hypothetical protein n=1 Tax=Rhizobium sp. PL01 TaxID=3085631 RepID=UPI002980E4E8|nr:hypothetical protein [Rhizobium sp. PL01]MDW5313745.1 hypothetical protein [Rhizobium sp. PL01]
MSDWAKPGVQCVCIKEDWGYAVCGPFSVPTRVPMINEVMTVSEVRRVGDAVFLFFSEIPERQQDGPLFATVSWDASCFRPLIKRKTDISMFTKMLTDTKTTVDA